jgi:hypothetical protein
MLELLPLLSSSTTLSGVPGDPGLPVLPALPEPAAPPLLISTIVPEIATPEGPMVMKFPLATRLSSMPAWITTLIPPLI